MNPLFLIFDEVEFFLAQHLAPVKKPETGLVKKLSPPKLLILAPWGPCIPIFSLVS